ncbi:MAG: carotenoid biosynthesis protein [Bacteroidota bacterium]
MPHRTALLVVVVTHLVGAIGLRSPWADWMILLTPVHLLLTFGLLFFYSDRSERLKASLLAIFALGLAVEILGVNTGLPFGAYVYLEGLGPKVMETPWLIGLNWALLSLATGSFAYQFLVDGTRLQRALLASGLMLALDVLMEPVAHAHRLWLFAGGVAPWQNYASWAVVAFAAQWLLGTAPLRNPLARPVLLAQACFFALSWLWPIGN